MKLKNKILFLVFLLLPFLLFGSILSFRYGLLGNISTKQPFEIISDMDNQNKLKSQYNYNNKFQIKTADSNVSIYITKYQFNQKEWEKAEKKYSNPISKNDTTLARGKNRFEVFCSPCHGFDGKASGTVITKVQLAEDEEGFPSPPDFLSEQSKKLTDSRIFHILSAGQNLMFPVNDKLSEIDKWSVILYIRELQNK